MKAIALAPRVPVTAWRRDGWPLCPICGDDELYTTELSPITTTLTKQAAIEGIHACYRCGPVELVDPLPPELRTVPA